MPGRPPSPVRPGNAGKPPGCLAEGQAFEGGTVSTVTMQDLKLEHAELLPSRETVNRCCDRTFISVDVEVNIDLQPPVRLAPLAARALPEGDVLQLGGGPP
jgi:hypothetical protein